MAVHCPKCSRLLPSVLSLHHHLEQNLCIQDTQQATATEVTPKSGERSLGGGERSNKDLSKRGKSLKATRGQQNAKRVASETVPKTEEILDPALRSSVNPEVFEPRSCGKCGFFIHTRHAWASHVMHHESDQSPHLCSVCGMAFRFEAALARHADQHSAERPHGCPECPSRFKGKPELKVHMRAVHTRLKKYVCEFCGKAFSMASNKSRHKKIYHSSKELEQSI